MDWNFFFTFLTGAGSALVAYYLIFGKKFIEKTAEKTAEKLFLRSIETEKEKIKQSFRIELEELKKGIQLDISKEIEPLRASLSRENISFQIINTEFNKLKFSRLDVLYIKLNELKVFSQANFMFPGNAEAAESRRQAFFLKYNETEVALHQATLYISDDVLVSAISMLNACHEAFSEFNRMTTSDRLMAQSSGNPELVRNFAMQNEKAFGRLVKSLDSLPSVLREVEAEFKRHIVSSKAI